MIRINLLGVERQKVKKSLPTFSIQAKQLTIACSLILVGSASGIGWWYWTIRQSAAQVETDIATAKQELQRLQSVLAEVKEFDGRRSQLQQRVQVIEQLRSGQTLPVQLLDHISRSVPDLLWLTDMDQKGDALTIQGRCNTLIALTDFVANLSNSGLLAKPIDFENVVEQLPGAQGQPGVEVIKFTVRAAVDRAAATKGGTKPAGTPAAGGGGGGAAAR
jgi:type IV pilus assembly protein PilN